MKIKLDRKFIYTIILCVVSIIFFSLVYIYKMKKIQESNLNELTNTTIELKKYRLKEIINRTIQEIDIEREFVLKESSKSLELFSNDLNSLQSQNINFKNKKSIIKLFSTFIKINHELEILVWDKSHNTLIYTNNPKINVKNFKNEKYFMNYLNKYKINTNKYIEKNNKIIALCISDDSIEEKVKNRMKYRTRKTILDNDARIWISQVINYNGENEYAIRLVHPNLIETEGEKLSANQKTKVFHRDMWLQINTTIIIAILYFVISGVTGFVLLNSKKLQEIDLVKQKNYITSRHYSLLESKYDKTNEIIHDIKNHLICINALAKDGQSQKVTEYINSINKDIAQLSDIAITHNKMLDIIINDKIHLMKKYNINFKYEIQFINLDFIQNKDICTIMSNLLDNSIESCIKSDNKNILLKLHCYNKSFIIIKLINSCDKNPIVENNRLISTKQEISSHGYGMKNIEKSVNKYSGNVTWQYNEFNKEFSMVIIFPIPKQ